MNRKNLRELVHGRVHLLVKHAFSIPSFRVSLCRSSHSPLVSLLFFFRVRPSLSLAHLRPSRAFAEHRSLLLAPSERRGHDTIGALWRSVRRSASVWEILHGVRIPRRRARMYYPTTELVEPLSATDCLVLSARRAFAYVLCSFCVPSKHERRFRNRPTR